MRPWGRVPVFCFIFRPTFFASEFSPRFFRPVFRVTAHLLSRRAKLLFANSVKSFRSLPMLWVSIRQGGWQPERASQEQCRQRDLVRPDAGWFPPEGRQGLRSHERAVDHVGGYHQVRSRPGTLQQRVHQSLRVHRVSGVKNFPGKDHRDTLNTETCRAEVAVAFHSLFTPSAFPLRALRASALKSNALPPVRFRPIAALRQWRTAAVPAAHAVASPQRQSTPERCGP